MNILLNEKLSVRGRQIACKVLSSTNSIENRPFVLCIPGGPGFGHISCEDKVKAWEAEATANNLALPNIILFDPLGCGESDTAENPAQEYSMENFTEMSAALVEEVKKKLSPHRNIELYVYGGSFGSMVAMNLPVQRPAWLDNSAISMKQIISFVGPNGAGDNDYARQYLDAHFSQHPQYLTMKAALNKLLDGKIVDQNDYIETIVFNLAPLYSESIERLLNSFTGKIIKNFYPVILPIMRTVDRIFKLFSAEPPFQSTLDGMTGCSLNVINQFFLTDHNGFNLTENVRNNLSLYRRLPITLISASDDHMVDYRTAQQINLALGGDSSAAVILRGKHMAAKDDARGVYEKACVGLLCQGHIPDEILTDPFVMTHTVTNSFQDRLARSLQGGASVPSSTSHTLQTFAANPVEGKGKQVLLRDGEDDQVTLTSVRVESIEDHGLVRQSPRPR